VKLKGDDYSVGTIVKDNGQWGVITKRIPKMDIATTFSAAKEAKTGEAEESKRTSLFPESGQKLVVFATHDMLPVHPDGKSKGKPIKPIVDNGAVEVEPEVETEVEPEDTDVGVVDPFAVRSVSRVEDLIPGDRVLVKLSPPKAAVVKDVQGNSFTVIFQDNGEVSDKLTGAELEIPYVLPGDRVSVDGGVGTVTSVKGTELKVARDSDGKEVAMSIKDGVDFHIDWFQIGDVVAANGRSAVVESLDMDLKSYSIRWMAHHERFTGGPQRRRSTPASRGGTR